MISKSQSISVRLSEDDYAYLMAIRQNGKGRIVNRPVGMFNQPGTSRPVGNCVGIKAPELN